MCKYSSVSVESTSNEGHVDQMSVVVRYLGKSLTKAYLLNQGHKAQDLFDGLRFVFQKSTIELQDYRDQSYDNASTMSGVHNGLRTLILKQNALALWVPCCNHSLNLVGKKAMKCCTQAQLFFSFLAQIYVYVTGSITRYDVLKTALVRISGERITKGLFNLRGSTLFN